MSARHSVVREMRDPNHSPANLGEDGSRRNRLATVSRRFSRCQSATCRYAPGFLSSAISVGLDHAGAAPPSDGGDFGVRETLLDEAGRSAAAETFAGEVHIAVAQLCEPVPEGCDHSCAGQGRGALTCKE
jgi:hypothetical protein